jgi:DNA-directed RNA polymerase specialized sigma24 family protein
MKAFVHLKDFEERSGFCSWLTRIAINSAFMILRKRHGRIEISTTLATMISEFGITGNPRIVLKVLKDAAHDERGKGCLRQQFSGCHRRCGTLFS